MFMKSVSTMGMLAGRDGDVRRLLFLVLILGFLQMSLHAQLISARVVPPGASVALGSNITFCVELQGNGLISYQWQKNGLNLPGQTNDCMTLTNLMIADGASYRATVFNSTSALESEEAQLVVTLDLLPGGDQFVQGRSINTKSNSVRGLSLGSSRELAEPFHFNLNTSNSVWYVWKAPATGIATFDTQGSTFDTLMAVYTGNALGALTEVTSDDDSGGYHSSRVRWNAVAGTEYRAKPDPMFVDGISTWVRIRCLSSRGSLAARPFRNEERRSLTSWSRI
jgi:hypothetical protein